MGSSYGAQYWQFKLQESRYLFWGMCHRACTPGGLDLDPMPERIREDIVNALVQITSLLEDKDKLATKYGMQQVGDIQPSDLSIIRRESRRQQNMVTALHTSSTLLRKVQWVVRDQGRFAELTQQLKTLVDVLFNMLPVPGGPWVGDTITAQTLADTLINGAGGNPIGGPQGLPIPHSGEIQQFISASFTAANREQLESSGSLRPVTPYFSIDAQRLEFPGQNLIKNTAPHLRSWARPRQVDPLSGQSFLLVEWREYDLRGGQESRVDWQARVEGLVKMLKEKPRSDSFRVFDCLGYFIDNSAPRFGITFRLPNDYNSGRDPAPMSLLEVMADYPKDVPYLGDRFRLAYHLAESVHALHTTGWLHKSICSRNVLLFRKNSRPAIPGVAHRPVSLETPYFTGFALSRPDGPATDSSLTAPIDELATYRHKDVQGLGGRVIQRYRAIYDIYSLGIVLLEIGTWQPIRNLYRPSAASDFDLPKALSQKVIPGIGVSMGENYMNAVRKCLEGSFERLDGFNPNEYGSMSYKENVRQGLLWEVVNVLRECRV